VAAEWRARRSFAEMDSASSSSRPLDRRWLINPALMVGSAPLVVALLLLAWRGMADAFPALLVVAAIGAWYSAWSP
jgi:hypothetical protein